MQSHQARPRPFFPLIDALRAFAALSVLVYHLIGHWDWAEFPTSGPLAWFRGGWMAVDVFFVISGFVIGLSAFAGIDAHGAGFRAPFVRGRLARIVPLHYLTLAAYIALVEPALATRGDFWPNLAAHLLFVHNAFLPFFGAINGPNWSLGAEMQFYVLMVLFAPALCRARPWRIAVLLVATAWAWRWGAYALCLPGPLDRAYWAQTQLPGMLDEFAIGLLLARFVRTPAWGSVAARMAANAWLRSACAVLAALCWWAVVAVYVDHDYWQGPATAVFFRSAVAACAGATVLVLCAWPMSKASAAARAALYLGKISYGIYLWHVPVLFFIGQHARLTPLQALGVAVPATLSLAALSWHAVEQPLLRRWGRQRQRLSASRIARSLPATPFPGLPPKSRGSG